MAAATTRKPNRRVHLRNTHVTPSSNSTKGEEREARTAVAREQNRAAFAGLAQVKAELVVALGDWNQPKNDPDLRAFVPAGFVWDNDAHIDHIGHLARATVKVVGSGSVQLHSDHRTQWISYAVEGLGVIRVVSHNFGNPSEAAAFDDLVYIADLLDADIVAVQEGGDRRDVVRRFLRLMRDRGTPWGVTWKRGTNPGRKVAVLHRKKTLRRTWWDLAEAVKPGRWLGPKGAGPDRSERKYVTKANYTIRRRRGRKENR